MANYREASAPWHGICLEDAHPKERKNSIKNIEQSVQTTRLNGGNVNIQTYEKKSRASNTTQRKPSIGGVKARR